MLTKQNTLQIKGVAILCMIAYHLFGFPDRLPDNVYVSWYGLPITKALQICVPIYLFMSGYGLQCTSHNKVMKWNEIIKRIKKIYKLFWWVTIPFIVLGIIAGYYHINTIWGVIELILNLLGVKSTYNGEWWFFSLYVELLILFYFISKLNVKWQWFIGIMILTLIVCRILNKVFILNNYGIIGNHIEMILINVNIFMMGCFFSKYDLFNVIIKKIDKYQMRVITCLISLIFPILIRAYIPFIGITEQILVPMFILGIVYMCKFKFISKYFEFLGKHSMNIWLIHSFFIYHFLKGVTFIFDSPIIMFITVTTLSLACSLVIEYSKRKIPIKL